LPCFIGGACKVSKPFLSSTPFFESFSLFESGGSRFRVFSTFPLFRRGVQVSQRFETVNSEIRNFRFSLFTAFASRRFAALLLERGGKLTARPKGSRSNRILSAVFFDALGEAGPGAMK
jgi:hypothetical protein